MVESVSVLLVSIAAVLTAIDQISIVLTTKKLWKQQQQLQQQLEMGWEVPNPINALVKEKTKRCPFSILKAGE